MLSEPGKLVLLVVCVGGCLLSFFTSSGFTLEYVNLGALRPPLHQHCRAPRQAAKKCLQDNPTGDETRTTTTSTTTSHYSQSCSKTSLAVTHCEAAVTRAYQQINMGGCPRPMHAVTLCEQEWCHGGGSAAVPGGEISTCQKECAGVRSKLNECVQRHVSASFAKQGLQRDGTLQGS